MNAKLAVLRSPLSVAEQRTADPVLFGEVCRLARTEGATLAHQGVEALAGSHDMQAMEDDLVAAGEGRLIDTVAELRKRGVSENEVAAYQAAAVIAMVETMGRLVAEFREAARVPVQ